MGIYRLRLHAVAASLLVAPTATGQPPAKAAGDTSTFTVQGDTLTARLPKGTMRVLVKGDTAWQLEPGPRKRFDAKLSAIFVQQIAAKRRRLEFEKRQRGGA